MAAAVKYYQVADGQVASSTTAVHTTPAAGVYWLMKITLFNTHTSDLTVTVAITRSGGSARKVWSATLPLSGGAGVCYVGEVGPGDVVKADDGGTGAKVDYVVSIHEYTA